MVVLIATLWPDQQLTSANWVPFAHHWKVLRASLRPGPHQGELVRYLLLDVVGNLLLYVPVGVAVAAAPKRWTSGARLGGAVGFAAGLSLAVELLQLAIPGRAADVDDVIFNTLGALLGALGFVMIHRTPKDSV